MAASIRKLGGCTPSFFVRSVRPAKATMSQAENGPESSLNISLLKCESTHVVSAKRAKPFLTSSCLVNSEGMFGNSGTSSSIISKSLPFVTRMNSSHRSTIVSQKCLHECRRFSFCMIYFCRTLPFCGTRHHSTVKTDSKKATADVSSKFNNYNMNIKCETVCENGRIKKTIPRLQENIMTVPNLLTTMRMASAPVLGYFVVYEHYSWALGLFVLAGISDMLDGFIARNFPNQTSALGSAIDPLADKLLITFLTVSLTFVGLIPLPVAALIVCRDVFLIVGGFYIRYRSLPPPITLSRYFDISDATVSLSPSFISKVNTGFQLCAVASSLAAPVYGFVDHIGLQILWWTTGAATFLSGLDYMISWKKYVTLLQKDQKEL